MQATTGREDLYINGGWVRSASPDRLDVLNPATEEVVGDVPRGNAEDVGRAVEAAHAALPGWKRLKPAERSRLLFRYTAALERHTEELANLESLQTGKPISAARGEIRKAVRYFEYYAGAVDKFMGEVIPEGGDYLAYTSHEPLGVTAHILPWNFPVLIYARSVAPALAVGNTAVVKPAEQAPLTTLLAAQLAEEAGLPPGVINVVTGLGEEAGAPLVRHPLVRGVGFTGSVETGRAILHECAERVIPCFPELGGKSPNVVFADADMDVAVENAYKAMFANAGQACLAGSRLLVERSIRDEFLERLHSRLRRIRLGNGADDPDMGPLISREQEERVLGHIGAGRSEGARVTLGGGKPSSLPKGFFIEPTVFDDVQPGMRIAREEIFGPVLTVFPFDNEREATRLANDTEYGLVAGIFTRDIHKAMRFAREVEAGRIFVNEYPVGDVSSPFGGYKLSGFGRVGGMDALRHFSQVKNVIIRYEGQPCG